MEVSRLNDPVGLRLQALHYTENDKLSRRETRADVVGYDGHFRSSPNAIIVRLFVRESFQPFRRSGAVHHLLPKRMALPKAGFRWRMGRGGAIDCSGRFCIEQTRKENSSYQWSAPVLITIQGMDRQEIQIECDTKHVFGMGSK